MVWMWFEYFVLYNWVDYKIHCNILHCSLLDVNFFRQFFQPTIVWTVAENGLNCCLCSHGRCPDSSVVKILTTSFLLPLKQRHLGDKQKWQNIKNGFAIGKGRVFMGMYSNFINGILSWCTQKISWKNELFYSNQAKRLRNESIFREQFCHR